MVETRQRFKNIQPGGFPEVIDAGGFTVLNRQPAVSRQALQNFTQRGAGYADKFRKLTFSGKD